MLFLAGQHFVDAHPQGSHNAVIQSAVGVVLTQNTGEGETQIGDVLFRVLRCGWFAKPRQVNTHQCRRGECIGGFFQHLAHTGLQRRFARVQMPGGVVEHQALGGVFFHQ